MQTPCIGICVLASGKCKGCNRTRKEIADWTSMTETERDTVMQRVKKEDE